MAQESVTAEQWVTLISDISTAEVPTEQRREDPCLDWPPLCPSRIL